MKFTQRTKEHETVASFCHVNKQRMFEIRQDGKFIMQIPVGKLYDMLTDELKL